MAKSVKGTKQVVSDFGPFYVFDNKIEVFKYFITFNKRRIGNKEGAKS